ncbi:acyl-CoA dehydrogenase family protein [Biformimicrobium ophioploci]|uniref:Acyl-CoA dehydrogenase family protein n=1 Tax=Biformimicrobium ophioploci TaxID=3036711 RepID=A0ABQ6M1E5_9GAMM|nr:acyl-CoA dehydrogenase family protein [Microbulbifer sp. NKW57]GMG88102.1 acyl-CoA dehydrogenase family protein [Microbulbifer sp. NKW57]
MFDIDATRPASPFYQESHQQWREQLRKFVDREIMPHINDWEESGELPDSLWHKAADMGLLQQGYPEAFGGISEGIDNFHMIVTAQELARCGAGGLYATLLVHGIALPPVVHYASDATRDAVIPAVLDGRAHISLAITEPGGGSDVANLRTRAVADGDDWIVSGEKTYITGGMRANWFTTAVRTGEDGLEGISLLLIPADANGVSRTPLDKKQGWWCSDTATIHFDEVRVPATNLVGEVNRGFIPIVHNFNHERLAIAASCIEYARVCLQDAIDWAAERVTFGRPLSKRQVIRHKFAEMLQRINASQAYLELCAWQDMHLQLKPADVALLKVQATQTMEYCAREAMQVIGGASYIRGCRVERIYREVRVNAIGGGSEEIMRDLAVRQLGI